jgi:DME family drug/metabolite transporter
MQPEFFALATAFFFAIHNVLVKKGLRFSNPPTALITSLVINGAVLWVLAFLYVPLHFLGKREMWIFVLVGLFQPGLTRFLTYKGIETLGVAITDPLRATTPMFAAFLAILFLKEAMTLPIFWGTLLIISGIAFLSYRRGPIKQVWSLFILYPLTASLLAGLSQVLRKFALVEIPHPLLGAAVTVTSSLGVSFLTVWISGKRRSPLVFNRQCLPFFIAAGIFVSLAMISIYYALHLGKVTVVIPISSTGPLFALTLSAIFLREVEKVTAKVVLGAFLIIAGVYVISVLR